LYFYLSAYQRRNSPYCYTRQKIFPEPAKGPRGNIQVVSAQALKPELIDFYAG
jgi:hypothetical protein